VQLPRDVSHDLLDVHTLRARDQSSPLLIDLAVWESVEAKLAASEALSAAIQGETRRVGNGPVPVFLLDEV
jgi:hypothetical protein